MKENGNPPSNKNAKKIEWHIRRQDSKEVALILIKIYQKLQKKQSFHTMCIFSYYKTQTTKKKLYNAHKKFFKLQLK
jgi:hypothetical protein